MIYWAQLFHFYQPLTQLPSVLEKICVESYRPLREETKRDYYYKLVAARDIRNKIADRLFIL